MSDKFDFNVARTLVQAVTNTASALDVKNGQMAKRFGNLSQYFKDSGYDAYAADMSSADKAIDEVITQLHVVGKHINDYANKLEEASK